MKHAKLLLATLLAIGSLVSTKAITVAAPDLVLGFSAKTGLNSTNSLEVALGSASSLVALSNGIEYSLSSKVSLLDIQAYGAGTAWQNNQVSWGVVGATDTGDNVVWGTVKTGLTVSAPGFSQGNVSNQIQTLTSALAAADATANSASAASLTGADSWKNRATTNLNFSYAPFNGKLTQNTLSLLSSSFQSAELYKFNEGGTADLVGTFKLYNDGNFTFTSFQAIPEPSTYAAILGVATLGFAAVRRRKQAQQLV